MESEGWALPFLSRGYCISYKAASVSWVFVAACESHQGHLCWTLTSGAGEDQEGRALTICLMTGTIWRTDCCYAGTCARHTVWPFIYYSPRLPWYCTEYIIGSGSHCSSWAGLGDGHWVLGASTAGFHGQTVSNLGWVSLWCFDFTMVWKQYIFSRTVFGVSFSWLEICRVTVSGDTGQEPPPPTIVWPRATL
jgi:hypothetical protein